jgi:hypothetical protein
MRAKAIILFLSGLLVIAGAAPLAGYAMRGGFLRGRSEPVSGVAGVPGCPVPEVQGIFAAPGDSGVAVDWLLQGTCVVFDARTQDSAWVRISAGESQVGHPGWVKAANLVLAPGLEDLPSYASLLENDLFRACVTQADSLNIRHGPGTNYLEIGHLLEGDCVDLTGRNADASWAVYDKGWLSTRYLQVEGNLYDLPVVVPPSPDFVSGKD